MEASIQYTTIQRVKKRTFEILEPATAGDLASRLFDVFILSLISLNVIAVILETVDALSTEYGLIFDTLERASVTIFTVEYLLRIWTCTLYKRSDNPAFGRVRFAVTPLALIDLISFLPFYLPWILPVDLRFVRSLRLFRIFRLLKSGRYSDSLQTLGYVVKSKKEELVITVFVVSVLLIFAASFMYFIEFEAQPEVFSSIPATMWWGIATLTTVGYGDIYPVTALGKFLGAIIAVLGIGMVALPTGILASGFAEAIQRKDTKQRTCPHCGEVIVAPPST